MARYSDNSGLGWKILSLFLALIIVAGVITGVVFWQKGNITFTPIEQEQPNDEDETPDDGEQPTDDEQGGAIIGEVQESGVSLMVARIPVSEFAASGVSALAETAYTLTATVSPSNATNTTLDWSVAFVNPSSSWATGKTVTDYVTVAPVGGVPTQATVSCLQPFGEQIKVVVVSRDNSEAKAECLVDYVARLEKTTVTYQANSSISGDTALVLDGTNSASNFPSVKVALSTSAKKNVSFSYETSDVYTLENEYTTTVVVAPSQGAYEILDSFYSIDPRGNSLDISDGLTPNQSFFVSLFGSEAGNNQSTLYGVANGLKNGWANSGIKYAFVATVTTTGKYLDENIVDTYYFSYDSADVGVSVSNVTLDSSSILF